jgi:alpha-mannosidase
MTDTSAVRTLDMVGIAHLDPVWLWPWQEGYAEVRATVRSALDRMDEDADFIFACDSVAYYAWVEENAPELFERMRARIAEGRWELAGGWWVEPDCNIPCGESLVRQGLLGQRYLLERFGCTARVGMNVDPFGHPGSLPQILRGQGLEGYVFHRPGAHEMTLPAPLFRWRSADGSEVLAYRIPHEYCTPAGDIGNHVEATLAQLPADADELMCFYGVGNHGGGPTRANIASIRRIDGTPGQPRLRFSSPERFFDRVRASELAGSLADVPVVESDLQHHAVGCYSAHSGIKAWNRRVEQRLLTAEAWSAIVACLGPAAADDRDSLGVAWQQLAFNQFHDILAGSAIESAYVDARDQLGEAASIAGRVSNRAQQRLAHGVDIPVEGASQPLLVFNSLPWPSHTPVEFEFGAHGAFDTAEAELADADGRPVDIQRTRSEARFPSRRRLVFEAEVPAFGYRLYRLWPEGQLPAPLPTGITPGAGRPGRPRATDTTLENDWLRVEVDPATGWLSSLVDRTTGASLLGSPAAPHAVVIDDPSDTWGHRVSRYGTDVGAFRVDRVHLVELGPVQAVIRAESSFGGSRLVEELVLGAASRALRVNVTLDWFEPARLLKLRVGTALTDVRATYEIPYGQVVRPADGHEEPGQTWVDVSGSLPSGIRAGLSVLNDAKYGFDILGGTVGITAVRSPVYAWHDPTVLQPDGIDTYQDQGRQRFSYALLPHAGDLAASGTIVEAARLNRPLTPLLEGPHRGSRGPVDGFVRATPPSVVITAIKRTEDPGTDLVVRAQETSGRSTPAQIELPLIGRTLSAVLGAYQIRTFRVPLDADAPVIEVDLLERPLSSAGTDATAASEEAQA